MNSNPTKVAHLSQNLTTVSNQLGQARYQTPTFTEIKPSFEIEAMQCGFVSQLR
jgi:hypothetical protein